MNTQDNNNMWDKLEENSANKDYTYFGKVMFDITQSAWEDQGGKSVLVPFDPTQHKNYVMSIEILIDAVPESPQPKYPQRTTDKTPDWYKVTKPSIQNNLQIPQNEIGRRLNEQYIKAIGEKYEHIKKDGSIKTYYPLRFLEVFADEATCKAAAIAFFNSTYTEQQEEAFPVKAPTNDAEKAIALKFLPALVTQAGKDPSKVAELLKSNNLVGKYFDLNSPEVIKLITNDENAKY